MKASIGIGAAGVCILLLSYHILPRMHSVDYSSASPQSTTDVTYVSTTSEKEIPHSDTRPIIRHVPLPESQKVIYMTSCVAGTRDFRDRLVRLIDETEINAVIIDIKDFSGTISFPPVSEAWKSAWHAAQCGARDMQEFIASLHEKQIFVIGRLTVFQDPFYTIAHPEHAVHKASDGSVWHDKKGLSFVDVGSKAYWDHIILLARDAYNIGFDELNFDYVRYPSDGNMQDIAFTNSLAGEYGNDKQANLEAFFKYLNDKLDDPALFSFVRHENTGRATATPWTSADLFGMTTTNTDDLSIGQVQERAAPYFDFIAPMVYPSHYPRGFIGLSNPNDDPYAVVHYAMSSGAKRMMSTTTSVQGFLHERIGTSTPAMYTKPAYRPDKLRTWIQDFDYGGDYDATDVRAQIQASYDAGVNSWMIWAPSNVYTREALYASSTNFSDAL
jgi:hypothetical protein